MASQPIAILDACVLFPEWLRDLLLRCAEAGLFQVRWSDEILDEVARNLERDRGLTAAQTARLVAAMQRAFPDAKVDGYHRHIRVLQNDPKDRHVVAAALETRGEELQVSIVTSNLKDFVPLPEHVRAISADDFLLELFESSRAIVIDLLWAHAQRRKRPPVSVGELLQGLSAQLPKFVAAARQVIDVRTAEQVRAIEARLIAALEEAKKTPQALPSEELRVALADFEVAAADKAKQIGDKTRARLPDVVRAWQSRLHSVDPAERELGEHAFRVLGITLSTDTLKSMSVEELAAMIEREQSPTH